MSFDLKSLAVAVSQHSQMMAANVEMASPPTVTDLGNTTSTLTGSKFISAITATTPFRYEMADTGVFSSKYILGYGPTTASARVFDQSQALTVAFDFDGQAFEIDTQYNAAGQTFRVWANEQVSPTHSTPTTGGEKYIKVDFGSRAQRRIVIDFDNAPYFAGVFIAGPDSVTAPSAKSTLKFAVVGDSYSYGLGTTLYAASYCAPLARTLGLVNWRKYGVSGTGFVTTPGGGAQNYVGRINDVLSFQPDLVFVQGSINDNNQSAGTVQTAATAYFAALKAGLPATTQIATSGPLRSTVPIASDLTIGTAIAAAAATHGIPYIDVPNSGWITGSGNTAAPTGTGNADYYSSNSPVTHPSLAGHAYFGTQLGRELAALWKIGL